MIQTPLGHIDRLRVGSVDFVSPDELKILLDIEAPEAVALNAGGVRPFPRVNGYLVVAVDDGYLVGQVEWLTVERSAFPKRKGVQDFGVVDLPYPQRRMSMNPLGSLRIHQSRHGDRYVFRRGADALPSVGAAVLLPTETQLRSIVESGERRRVRIGTSPLAGNADVAIDPDRLFGRHLAVLGNTGSGKSCSVAGLIRWSLKAACAAKAAAGRANARFVILDPNGEYSRAFGDDDDEVKTRIFKVTPTKNELPLEVPLWFWNSAEWSSFTQASSKTQRPLLRRALREVKAGRAGITDPTEEEKRLGLRRYLSSALISIRRDLNSGAIKTEATKFGHSLSATHEDLTLKSKQFADVDFAETLAAIDTALKSTFSDFVDKNTGKTIHYYKPFAEAVVNEVAVALDRMVDSVGGIIYQEGPDEDVPVPFKGTDLADHLQILAAQENMEQYVDFLVSRIRTLLSDTRIKSVIADTAVSLEEWLNRYVGKKDAEDGELSIIDLSLVPSAVVHVVTAVVARMIFEALQRFRKINGASLPTVLVIEEAHTFIKRYKDDIEDRDAATVCCQVFERIAREGRKFGLGLVLSSQRPSELSPTVLSQCNSFLLHRISNDRDQELVHKLVPDNLRGLLRELPSLPSQHAILLGWASELPILLKLNDLPKWQQPRSDDPDFWNVWVGTDEDNNAVVREADWAPIATDWQATAVMQAADNPAEDAEE